MEKVVVVDAAEEDGTMGEAVRTGEADVAEGASKGEEDEATTDKSHPHQTNTTLGRKQVKKRRISIAPPKLRYA